LYKRGSALYTEDTDPVPAYRPYRTWRELLREPKDMTPREKIRLAQIKLIPETIRESISQREQELREEIKRLERELDQLCDFLNGEWDPAPEISSKERSVSESSIEFK